MQQGGGLFQRIADAFESAAERSCEAADRNTTAELRLVAEANAAESSAM
jgi:hypothetical protein